jgi:hypothetical protein
MNWWRVMACFCVVMAAAGQQAARVYPGARLDRTATEQAKVGPAAQPEFEVAVYTTADGFDKVYGFLQKSGREYRPIGSRVRKLPNGQEMRDAFFIFDGAPNLTASKRWAKIQRPYIGEYGLARNGGGQNDIKNVTAIVLNRKK